MAGPAPGGLAGDLVQWRRRAINESLGRVPTNIGSDLLETAAFNQGPMDNSIQSTAIRLNSASS